MIHVFEASHWLDLVIRMTFIPGVFSRYCSGQSACYFCVVYRAEAHSVASGKESVVGSANSGLHALIISTG